MLMHNASLISGLHGRVRVCQFGATYRVRITDIAPDLRVRVVRYGAAQPGQWQFVPFGEDFSIEIVQFGEDFTVSLNGI